MKQKLLFFYFNFIKMLTVNKNNFDYKVNGRVGDLLNELEISKGDGNRSGDPKTQEMRRTVRGRASESFEELCDMAQSHPLLWTLYKIRHLFDGHLQEIIKRVDETVGQGN